MIRPIRRRHTYPQPPERVWQALTDPAEITTWFMATDDFRPEPGATFVLRDADARGWSGVVRGEVVESEPPRRLVYAWRADGETDEGRVTWTLEPHPGGGTRLELVHEGFTGLGGLVTRTMLDFGWRSLLKKDLVGVLAGPARQAGQTHGGCG